MRGMVAVLLAAGAVTAAGLAQQTIISKGMVNPNAPVEITSSDMSVDQKTGLVVYSGNVLVHQGDVRLRANLMRAKLEGSKPRQIYADGKVVIDSPSGVATGDNGVYDVDPRIVTLTGHVVLTQNQNVLRGEKLVVNLVTGVAKLDGGAGGRIHSLLSSGPGNSQPDNNKTGGKKTDGSKNP